MAASVMWVQGCVGAVTDANIDDTESTDDTPEFVCDGEGDVTVELGEGAGDVFEPFEEGQEVQLQVASQGGFGVGVWLRTTGLASGGSTDVLLETELFGVLSGTYLAENQALSCTEENVAKLWGITVGLDPDEYSTIDDLIDLAGDPVVLIVTVTDENGKVGVGTQTVTMQVGA